MPVRSEIGGCCFSERHRFRGVQLLAQPIGLAILDRVNALMQQAPRGVALLTGFGECEQRDGAQPHHPRPAMERELEHPAFRPAWSDLQMQAAAIVVQARLGLSPDIESRQSIPCAQR
jgi:hypothetical protein